VWIHLVNKVEIWFCMKRQCTEDNSHSYIRGAILMHFLFISLTTHYKYKTNSSVLNILGDYKRIGGTNKELAREMHFVLILLSTFNEFSNPEHIDRVRESSKLCKNWNIQRLCSLILPATPAQTLHEVATFFPIIKYINYALCCEWYYCLYMYHSNFK
jgi:hypothetical protein